MAVQYKDLTKARKVIAVVMFIFAFFNSAYVQLNTPLLSTMIETQGWTNEMLCNLIVTMGNFAQIPAYLICLALGGRMNKKKMAYLSIACFLVGGLLIIPCSTSIYLVLLCRFIVGFGSGILILISAAEILSTLYSAALYYFYPVYCIYFTLYFRDKVIWASFQHRVGEEGGEKYVRIQRRNAAPHSQSP